MATRAKRVTGYFYAQRQADYYYCEHEETIISEFKNYTEDRDIMDEREYDYINGEMCCAFSNDPLAAWFSR